MANIVHGIISMSIGAVVMASVFITTVKNQSQCYGGQDASCTNGTAWTSSEIALWGLITLVGIAGMIYGVMNVFGLG